MLEGYPNFHYFKNGNSYSGAHIGMRYFIEPIKEPDPNDETGKKKMIYLQVTIWPEPWSLEHTAPEKQLHNRFPGSDEGISQTAEWIRETFESDVEKWSIVPSILDCEPDIIDPAAVTE